MDYATHGPDMPNNYTHRIILRQYRTHHLRTAGHEPEKKNHKWSKDTTITSHDVNNIRMRKKSASKAP